MGFEFLKYFESYFFLGCLCYINSYYFVFGLFWYDCEFLEGRDCIIFIFDIQKLIFCLVYVKLVSIRGINEMNVIFICLYYTFVYCRCLFYVLRKNNF